MNEWSPGRNRSSLGSPTLTRRSLRSQQDEFEKEAKPVAQIRSVSKNRSQMVEQHSIESVSKTSLSTNIKKAGGNGPSDPRFKRVIGPGVSNDACVGTEGKPEKTLTENLETSTTGFSVWNAPEFKSNKPWFSNKTCKNLNNKLKGNYENSENFIALDNSNFAQSFDHLKAVDKLSFNHDFAVNSLSKESSSACSQNTKNSSNTSYNHNEESLVNVPSTTRVNKVQNWIHNQTIKPEKKHSVVTVIGQMQEPHSLSSAFQEIDKRRKLAKELDKYAVCKNLIQPDEEKNIAAVMLTTFTSNNNDNSLNNNTDIRKETILSDSNASVNSPAPTTKSCENNLKEYDLPINDNILKRADVNTSDSTIVSVSRKHSSVKKMYLKNDSNIVSPVQGKLEVICSGLMYRKIFCILMLMSGVISWLAFFSLQKGSFVPFDMFNSKPKPISWYERIFSWLWELFRPSGNYQRTKPWPSL